MINRPTLEPLTPERHYSALLDSVTLVNQLCALDILSPLEIEAIQRNVDHMELMLTKDFWTDEDMTPVSAAVASGKIVLSSVS